MRTLLIAAVVLSACSSADPSTAPANVDSAAPQSGAVGVAPDLVAPTTAAGLPALVAEAAPTRAVACYALTTVHAQAERSRWQPRYQKLSALWATEVLRQANGDATVAEQRRAQAVAALRSTPDGLRRAAGSMCAQPPVPGAAQMTEEQRTMAEIEQGGSLYDAIEGPLTIADMPDLIGEGAGQRTVNCQAFTALQAAALRGAEQARYQAASDRWALQNRRENDGDRDSAAQLMATTVAGLNNPPPEPPALLAAADRCLAAAPLSPS